MLIMKKLLDIYYYLFYRFAHFAKKCFNFDGYAIWGAMVSTFLIWNFVTTIIEWILGEMHIFHNDWYYIIIGIATTFLLAFYVLTDQKYAQLNEKYEKEPIKAKTLVDILIIILLILSVYVQVVVSCAYDVREYISIRDRLFH